VIPERARVVLQEYKFTEQSSGVNGLIEQGIEEYCHKNESPEWWVYFESSSDQKSLDIHCSAVFEFRE
jgi:hypothetical protein